MQKGRNLLYFWCRNCLSSTCKYENTYNLLLPKAYRSVEFSIPNQFSVQNLSKFLSA